MKLIKNATKEWWKHYSKALATSGGDKQGIITLIMLIALPVGIILRYFQRKKS
jgi:hypothetical protein